MTEARFLDVLRRYLTMSANAMLPVLFRYQAWADEAFMRELEALDAQRYPDERREALRLLNHCFVVNQIFKAHLTGTTHGFKADNTAETPTPGVLREALAASDGWLMEYAASATPDQLAEPIAFTFTDGDKGRMTREEMLFHVAVHGSYHRGEVGRILKQIGSAVPWDTFAVHLHQIDPGRRLR